MAGGLERPGRVPAATIAIVALILLVAGLLVPGQLAALPSDAGGVYALLAPWPLPGWLDEGAALPLRPFVHASPVHALLAALGTAAAGWMHERRFGTARTGFVFLVGSALGLALSALIGEAEPLGASGGALALFGALLMDLARRRASASLFGPLVAPLLLHGAIDGLVPGDYSIVHGAGLLTGAVLARLLASADRGDRD
ncbi:MAG TPA: rhomboid family intramembrane serine protease [Chloroflexota bacterium]|jgi:membrane associated rhomboid family serine protease